MNFLFKYLLNYLNNTVQFKRNVTRVRFKDKNIVKDIYFLQSSDTAASQFTYLWRSEKGAASVWEQLAS